MTLTTKRKVFIEEYLKCWNATEAARRVGYKHPNTQGPRLLLDVSVQEEVKRRLTEIAMDADEVLTRLSQQARTDLGPFISKTDDGLNLDWEKLKEADLTYLVKSLTPTRYGTKIELHDAQAALVHLARSHGMFKDRVDVTSGDQPLQITTIEIIKNYGPIPDSTNGEREGEAKT